MDPSRTFWPNGGDLVGGTHGGQRLSQEIDTTADKKAKRLEMTEIAKRGSIAAGFFTSDFQARQAMQTSLRDLK